MTIGRHGARRGVTAPVMQVSTAKLKQLKGEGISTSKMGSLLGSMLIFQGVNGVITITITINGLINDL